MLLLLLVDKFFYSPFMDPIDLDDLLRICTPGKIEKCFVVMVTINAPYFSTHFNSAKYCSQYLSSIHNRYPATFVISCGGEKISERLKKERSLKTIKEH